VRCEDRNLLIPHPAIQITAMNQNNRGPGAYRLVKQVAELHCDESTFPALRTLRSVFAPTGDDSDECHSITSQEQLGSDPH
jgi:hypothetical protein